MNDVAVKVGLSSTVARDSLGSPAPLVDGLHAADTHFAAVCFKSQVLGQSVRNRLFWFKHEAEVRNAVVLSNGGEVVRANGANELPERGGEVRVCPCGGDVGLGFGGLFDFVPVANPVASLMADVPAGWLRHFKRSNKGES